MPEKPNILLVEDNVDFRTQMARSFGREFRIINAPNLRTASMSLSKHHFDLVLLDLSFNEDDSLEGLDQIKPFKRIVPHTPIIVVTSDTNSSTTVRAIREGAADFVRKDEFNITVWTSLFKRIIEESKLDAQPVTQLTGSSNFIGQSEAILKLKDKLRKVSEHPDFTVLVLGETGVGKEVAAQYLHRKGARKDKPFQAINLSTINQSLMASELFGHRKGAFTDAKFDRKGAFEQAHGGVLFLDEIGEVNHDIQVKLLRFLQDKVITPVGGTDIKLDVQVVAATNRDLKGAVKEKRFREDLYYRLASITVDIPPLRERPEDVSLLLDYYLTKNNTSPSLLSDTARRKLCEYSWPGNVRQLVNVVRQIYFQSELEGLDEIGVKDLPNDILISPRTEKLSVDEEQAIILLDKIEVTLPKFKRKQDAAEALDMDLNKLTYHIKTNYQNFPHLFEGYPIIMERYKTVLQKLT